MIMTEAKKTAVNTDFAEHVASGLTATPKKMSSRYFYDNRGDKLFQQIMNMPEYYLTDCEMKSFRTKKMTCSKPSTVNPSI